MADRVAGAVVLACGALASELRTVLRAAGLANDVEVRYLPANFHNRPEHIVPALEEHLAEATGRTVFVAYADCGTGGGLDRLLGRYPGVERLPGAHCYEFFADSDRFAALQAEEPGTFYLTDFLAKHFDSLVWEGLGLDRHPQLRDVYFANYRRVVLLSQSSDPSVVEAGRRAAGRLGLEFVHHQCGLDSFTDSVVVPLRRREHDRVS